MILSWGGWGFLIFGVGLMWREHTLLKGCTVAEGLVIDVIASPGTEGGDTYAPLISYKAHDGKEYTFKTRLSSSHPGVTVGDAVKVAYPLESPAQGRFLKFMYRYGLAWGLAMLGFVMLTFVFGIKHGDAWLLDLYGASPALFQR